jgi:hypothetical protein
MYMRENAGELTRTRLLRESELAERRYRQALLDWLRRTLPAGEDRCVVGMEGIARYLGAMGVRTARRETPAVRTVYLWRARYGLPVFPGSRFRPPFSTALCLTAWVMSCTRGLQGRRIVSSVTPIGPTPAPVSRRRLRWWTTRSRSSQEQSAVSPPSPPPAPRSWE